MEKLSGGIRNIQLASVGVDSSVLQMSNYS